MSDLITVRGFVATDPTAGVTTAVDGFFIGLAKRSFQVA